MVGASVGFLVLTQSLTWDTLCAERSHMSLIAAFLQLVQQVAWDTLLHLKLTTTLQKLL